MDLNRLYEILGETTVQLRKGEVFTGTPTLVAQAERGEELKGGGVLTMDLMPHENEAPDNLVKIDCELLTIAVNRHIAEFHRAELIEILKTYPRMSELIEGPSYIKIGAEIGDQGAAFQLFALGEVLGLWKVITPKMMGFKGKAAKIMAGQGYIMITPPEFSQ